ncbi:GNAT family N-acetyltransferase [Baekduia soli]|uniref:GNAT family N-acetyltransferase n=1 Tax=Baekduia soli TaxID=496014 RepID=A0A5B8U3S2_9ACTN|nr:GNAT family N-acetyltransferase [Baekduia soli]QEC47538.1 GNAT family N-acetyltransferase [Baekduia soli]
MVTLRPLSESDRRAAYSLRVAPGQERFVSGVAESVREAADHPGAHALCWVVHDGDTPVGFVMVADEVDGPDYLPHYLWKLLIDERHQRKGHGTAVLDLVVAYFRGRPGVETLTTKARLGDGDPVAFYERYGFERAGEAVDGEVLLRLRLASQPIHRVR